jgi:DNA mismatch repair ATPase MutS
MSGYISIIPAEISRNLSFCNDFISIHPSHRMQKKTAGLSEVFKLYLFTRSLPGLVSVLSELLESSLVKAEDDAESNENFNDCSDGLPAEKVKEIAATMRRKFIAPLEALAAQFALYQQLIEHVIDLDQLPDLVINPQHDPELQELRSEQLSLEAKADKLLKECRNDWASFADVKLETSPQHGLIFRSTSGDDERQLRASNSSVRVIAIKKVIIVSTIMLHSLSCKTRFIINL